MLRLPSSVRIYLAAEAVDGRRGLDGWAAARRRLLGDPLRGHLFGFLNQRKNRIKVRVGERTGYVLLNKRRERGTLALPTQPVAGRGQVEVAAAEFGLMLEGLDVRGGRRRPRGYRSPHPGRGPGREGWEAP